MKKKVYLIILLGIALLLRLYGINWDNGYHFHPDERMLMMVAERITFFSQLDPNFFNYGTLPVYILKGFSQIIELVTPFRIANYDGMLYVGRALSVILDLLVLVLIYKISLLLFKKKETAYYAVFFYTFAFFPIQNTHFFIVDTFLNFFGTVLIYLLLIYCNKPALKTLFLIGITFAAAMTTKISALLFLPVVGLVFFLSGHGKFQQKIIKTAFLFVIFGTVTLLFSFMFMPFAFIHVPQFLREVAAQLQMNSNPYTFPYTLQYVDTLPYLYYIKNIAVWGLGPFIFAFFLLGLYELAIKTNRHRITDFLKHHHKNISLFIIFCSYYAFYFLVIGKSSVKFMRYMLVMYPFFAIIAGYGAYALVSVMTVRKKQMTMIISIFFIVMWTLAFIGMYRDKTTRIRASDWIYKYIPTGSTLAVEHWDDRVPVFDAGKYKYEEMTLYERPDDDIKWQLLNEKLKKSDYIIIASNRLYTPLQKLKDCNKFLFCYPETAAYYEALFSDKTDFRKITEFTSYPALSLGSWKLEIIDDTADESFTVYDHPKILIYRRMY